MKKIALILLTCFVYLPGLADVAPLPEIQFSFIYNTEGHPLISPAQSELVQCKDRLCMETTPLGIYGAQRFTCGPGACEAIAYDFEPFAKLVIGFEDGTIRVSNVFSLGDALITPFNVYVNEDSLIVEPVDTPAREELWKRPQAWASLMLILLLELLCTCAYVLYTKKSFKILYGVAIANIITTIFTWGLLVHYVAQSALLWIFCVAVETLLIGLINRKQLSFKEAGMLSVMINVTSYTLGMILSFVWAQI